MMQHWSHKVSEVTLSYFPGLNEKGKLPITIKGGSESGQFCSLGNALQHDKIKYHSTAKLQSNDLVLEVQGQKVAGYTSHDLRDWIISVGQNSTPVLFKTAKAGTLQPELRPYLNSGFPKGSIDHDTQMTIRENLFQRTVPCTTRPAREGEINGVDYTFVTIEEFRELERSGNLLESGEFDGNFYGMPKPPGEESPSDITEVDSRPGAHPSSKGKRERNRSTIEATSNKHHYQPPPDEDRHLSQRPDSAGSNDGGDKLGPLPINWEMSYTPDGHMYFIDHNTETTHWTDPRIPSEPESVPSSPSEDNADLPYGWEKVVDPDYGTYYIDHMNRTTQYDPPSMLSPAQKEGFDALHSPAPSARSNKSLPSYREIDSVSQHATKPFFTKHPEELSGEIFKTSLVKSVRGFGFTIVGGEQRDEEFLQIKNVVPNGPADQNGMLRTGDVLVRVNDHLVLGYTHSDVVQMFQSIQPGSQVNLEVCRGYPLAFDPNDPNTEIVTTLAVSMPKLTPAEMKQREVERATRGGDEDDDNSSLDNFADSLLQDLSERKNESVSSPSEPKSPSVLPLTGQMFSIEIVRGEGGFGFTIADSALGQKVKHILDKGRCKTLQEGDILVRIAYENVRNVDHARVVNVLKSCPKGVPTEIVVERGGMTRMPTKPNQPRMSEDLSNARDDESEGAGTPPPLPSKGRLNSDNTFDSKENLTNQHTELITQQIKFPGILKDTSNFHKNPEDKPYSYPPGITTVSQPNLQSSNNSSGFQHPVMNQYQSNVQPGGKESFYDIPNKFRSDSALTPRQRFDMLAPKQEPSRKHEFGQPLDSNSRTQPQVLPPLPNGGFPISGRSRTPGPEHMRAPPERTTNDRFRSKTPNPNDHRRSFHQNNLNDPLNDQFDSSVKWHEDTVELVRGQAGFGFRIVGGPEEGTQVAIGYIVPNGAADQNGRLQKGDEIVKVDGKSTIGESHHHVVGLMGQASSHGKVILSIRRKIVSPEPTLNEPKYPIYKEQTSTPLIQNQLPPGREGQPFDVLVSRNENEGFGFIIVSSVERMGAVIGRIIEKSPAERCGRLKVGDRILAVNNIDISKMLHEDIVNLIKESGFNVKLAVLSPPTQNDQRYNSEQSLDKYFSRGDPNRSSLMSTTALPTSNMNENDTLIRNMHSHTTTDTADRYVNPLVVNNRPPSRPGIPVSPRMKPDSSAPSPAPIGMNQPTNQPRPYEPPKPINTLPQEPIRTQHPHHEPMKYQPSANEPIRSQSRGPSSNMSNPSSSQISPPAGTVMSINLMKGSRGFGFSIRGGREFNNMPLYVLRIAEDGAAFSDRRLQVGDELLEINQKSTQGMSHSDAINLIQNGGNNVRLLVRRTGLVPPVIADQSVPSPQGSGMSSPAIRNPVTSSQSQLSAHPNTAADFRRFESNRESSDPRFSGASDRGDPNGPYSVPPPRSSYIPPPAGRPGFADSSRPQPHPADRYVPPEPTRSFNQPIEPTRPFNQAPEQSRPFNQSQEPTRPLNQESRPNIQSEPVRNFPDRYANQPRHDSNTNFSTQPLQSYNRQDARTPYSHEQSRNPNYQSNEPPHNTNYPSNGSSRNTGYQNNLNQPRSYAPPSGPSYQRPGPPQPGRSQLASTTSNQSHQPTYSSNSSNPDYGQPSYPNRTNSNFQSQPMNNYPDNRGTRPQTYNNYNDRGPERQALVGQSQGHNKPMGYASTYKPMEYGPNGMIDNGPRGPSGPSYQGRAPDRPYNGSYNNTNTNVNYQRPMY